MSLEDAINNLAGAIEKMAATNKPQVGWGLTEESKEAFGKALLEDAKEKTKPKAKPKAKAKAKTTKKDKDALANLDITDDPLAGVPEESGIDKIAVLAVLKQVVRKMGDAEAKVIFSDFGAVNITDLKEECYADCHYQLTELLAK